MSWFKLDDQGAFHAKVLAAGNAAYGAWCRAGQWSSAHLTDGAIPRAVAISIAPLSIWQRLARVKLVEDDDGGWRIHDFLVYNPTAVQVRDQREKRANAGTKGGKQKYTNRLANDLANANHFAKQTASEVVPPLPSPDPLASTATAVRDGLTDEAAIVAELRRHPALASLDFEAAGAQILATIQTQIVCRPYKLEWALAAIGEAAGKCAGASMSTEAIASKVGSFVRAARAPRPMSALPANGYVQRPGAPILQKAAKAGQYNWQDRMRETK